MRFRSRPTPKEPLNTTPSDNAVQQGGPEMPPKAQSLLGPTGRVNNSGSNKKDDTVQLRRAEQKNMVTLLGLQRVPSSTPLSAKPDMSPWSTTDVTSRSSSDVLPTPTSGTGRSRGPYSKDSSVAVQPRQFYPEHQPSIESIRRNYYDPSKQPLQVSQQTSASAVRDMGLRKGSPVVHEMASDPMPLKSAMKKPKPTSPANGKHSSKKPKNLDLTSLFPHPKTSGGRLLSPAKFSYSPSAMTDTTEFFPQDTVRAELRRQGPNGRLATYKSNPSEENTSTSNTLRVKIFEPDIYDSSKTHIRRPPKGVQNWFDGLGVSSDEEDQEAIELPANPLRPSVEGMPSDFSPYGVSARGNVHLNGGHSTPAQGNLHPNDSVKDITRHRVERRGSECSTVTGSSSSSAILGGQKRGGESRLAHSKLESESVLSLSSESEEERNELSPIRDSRFVEEEALTAHLHRPPIPPRRMGNAQGSSRVKSDSTAQTSGSIPIRLTDGTAAPPATDRSIRSRPSDPSFVAGLSKLGSPRDSESQASKSRQMVHSPRELRSAGGETTSSVPSDASKVMAVTEEEMMLLELMRKKRAAMQKNSFSEGYRLALKQEQEHLTRRSQTTLHKAMTNLDKNNERDELLAIPSSGRQSRNESIRSEDGDRTKRYSAIRKQDVDKSFKLGRFLAMEATQEEPYVANMARMERFLMMKPSLADAIQDNRPISGTEIEADSMTQTEDDEIELAATDDGGMSSITPSPMQRLTNMARDGQRISPPEDYFGESNDRERAFLSSNDYSESASVAAFPTPPSLSDRHRHRVKMLPPPMPHEVFVVPEIPERSPNRTPLNQNQTQNQKGTRPPITPRVSSGTNRYIPERLAPLPNFSPLEVPTSRTRSPSISTSRPSPLTPTFPNANLTPLDQTMVQIAGSDNASLRNHSYTSSPELRHVINTVPTPPREGRRFSKRMPPRIDTTSQKTVDRVTSATSITSAGEDVLAAWAELGGGSDAYGARRRGR